MNEKKLPIYNLKLFNKRYKIVWNIPVSCYTSFNFLRRNTSFLHLPVVNSKFVLRWVCVLRIFESLRKRTVPSHTNRSFLSGITINDCGVVWRLFMNGLTQKEIPIKCLLCSSLLTIFEILLLYHTIIWWLLYVWYLL